MSQLLLAVMLVAATPELFSLSELSEVMEFNSLKAERLIGARIRLRDEPNGIGIYEYAVDSAKMEDGSNAIKKEVGPAVVFVNHERSGSSSLKCVLSNNEALRAESIRPGSIVTVEGELLGPFLTSVFNGGEYTLKNCKILGWKKRPPQK